MSTKPLDDSPAAKFCEQFQHLGPEAGPRVTLAVWDQLPIVQQAAIAADWGFWARKKQLAPKTNWITWGFLTGRGFGKTIALSNHVNDEVESGNAGLIGLCAQDEQSSIDIQVEGPSGILATAKPWFRPRFEASSLQIVWPNGARAYVRTPEVPGKIRGLEYHLFWASEIQSWPIATRQEALDNIFLSTRLGYSRVLWDATSKRRHPLLKQLLAAAEEHPEFHHIIRGTTYENAANLGDNYVSEIERKFKGTQRGREELFGEMLEDAEGALFKQAWIDDLRAPAPAKWLRKVIGVDPAVSTRKGSDTTGIVEAGLGPDAREYVLRDASGKHEAGAWGRIVLDWYVSDACDLVLAETNKGGNLVTENLRALAKERQLEVVVVDKDARPRRMPGKVFVKSVYARGAKEDRAEPVATAYERRRVVHALGADLSNLEDTLTTWEPSPNADSPGDLDALVHASVELLDLANGMPDPAKAFEGIVEASKQLSKPQASTSLAQVFSSAFGNSRGNRI